MLLYSQIQEQLSSEFPVRLQSSEGLIGTEGPAFQMSHSGVGKLVLVVGGSAQCLLVRAS